MQVSAYNYKCILYLKFTWLSFMLTPRPYTCLYVVGFCRQIIVKYYRDKDLEHRHKDDNVNSVVITTGVYSEQDVTGVFKNLTNPVEISFKFIDVSWMFSILEWWSDPLSRKYEFKVKLLQFYDKTNTISNWNLIACPVLSHNRCIDLIF